MARTVSTIVLLSPCILLGLVAAEPAKPAVETWADPNLSITAGLELWLDASRQNAARQAYQKPILTNERPLDIWYDASGMFRHVLQKNAAARPRFITSSNHTAIRFDGVQQHLTLAGLAKSYSDVTIIVVAAPFANPGDFRGFLAMNKTGENDYTSGLNLDFGWLGTTRFESLNVEGNGFGGAVNLMKEPLDFGTVSRLCVSSTPGKVGTRLFVNGKPQGERDRASSTLRIDQLTIGARFYTNGGPPQVRGFLEGDIAEVLIYDRVLSDAERANVDRYLAAKHGDLLKVALPPRPGGGKALVSVPPVPVQVFLPGFTVRELPVDLTNINNIRYRPDGKLVALAYDGNIYLLSSTREDGLENKVELFWDNKGRLRAPIGMALTPPNYKLGNGVFVASKGKCSLIVGTDGDDKADKEIIVADGWKELPHGVDALGVAVGDDGSVYFGLGCADYTNAYQIDKDGKAHYRLDSERGTILRVSPDFKKREIFCTGIRFPVGIGFNREGDLFCTDQEGATWLPNGNPFDELLHIEKGRHYGFPPRDPKHLPNVIDEPSVFDYGPQHQSTCGLCFWGPNDALVTGYSRGKLYRTDLFKTATGGYVARNHLLASLNMLPVDVCFAEWRPWDLVVATHSGGPDWGSGPSGKGKLYRISDDNARLPYDHAKPPRPVFAWAQTPQEVRIAFDRPLEPQHLQGLSGKATIEYGQYVSAGDRFEVLRPGYQAVQDQLRAPRFDLPVHSVQLARDRQSLILATAPQTVAAGYALTLPGLGRRPKGAAKSGELPQYPETDLRYDLCGVAATVQNADGHTVWTGWLPHLDLDVARSFTARSNFHDELWVHMSQPGKLTLRSQLDLTDMLRPAVQPGSKIDYEWPAEEVTLTFRVNESAEIKCPQSKVTKSGPFTRTLTLHPKQDQLFPIEIAANYAVPASPLMCSVTYHTNEDKRPRALPLYRFLLPWATKKKEDAATLAERDIPELRGGNWQRGRRIFFSEEAACFKCHTINGEGGVIGPNLANLPQRDYASVLRDIAEPSFALNPDYISYNIELKDGRVLNGVFRTEEDKLHVGDTKGNTITIRRDQIETMRPSPVSIMPEGIPKLLGTERLRDLLTYLLTPPPRMPEYGKETPPPARSLAEVQAVLAGAPAAPAKLRPLHIVLVSGKKDHGLGEHDYPAWQKVWQKLLSCADETKVTTAFDWPSADAIKTADVLVFYQQGKWTPERAKDIDAFLARGGGLLYLHYAVDGGADAPGFAQRIGLAWGPGAKFRHGPLDLGFETGNRHPIARNFDKVHFHDESYWQLAGDTSRLNLLASGMEDGKAQPLFWTMEPSHGRVFVSIPGHYAWTFDDPLFRMLLLRALAWTAREPVDRFNDLATFGARMK